MSLEDMLALKGTESPTKSINGQNGEKNGHLTRRPSDSWDVEKMFSSKIPSAAMRSSQEDILEENNDKTKVPAQRNLGRRSASVTDMKKVFEKPETVSPPSGTSSPGDQMVGIRKHLIKDFYIKYFG